jgi:hypothetical protein
MPADNPMPALRLFPVDVVRELLSACGNELAQWDPETEEAERIAQAIIDAAPSDHLLAAVASIPDPADRLLVVRSLEAGEGAEALAVIRRTSIAELRARHLTWASIGTLLGITGQRAEQLSKA